MMENDTWITISPGIFIKATKYGYIVRTARTDITISYDILEKLREQEWELDTSESRRK